MRRALVLPLGMIALAGAACGMVIGTESWFNSHSYGRQNLSTRASFDMSCPAAQLQYLPMGPGSDYATVGVSGCDRRAVYTFVADRWIANSAGVAR